MVAGTALWLLALTAMPGILCAEELSATAVANGQEFFLGESFIVNLQVSGSDSPDKPDLSGLIDFTVKDLGSRTQNSSEFVVANGQMSSTIHKGCVFTFQLTPKRTGIFTIPPIEITDQGRKTQTGPIQLRIIAPEETEDFKLRLSLSKTRCYVGEPVTLRAAWYVGKKVNGYELSVPVLANDVFVFADPHGQYSPVQTPAGSIMAAQNRGSLDGKEYDVVTFCKVLIPMRAGTFEIPPVTVACNALTGVQREQSPFGNDFPFFNNMREVYKKAVVASGGLSLEVLPLPKAGRPANFAGHVGEYRISVAATPTEVSVGDPITLTIALSGAEHLDHVDLPGLNAQPALTQDFKIPQEMAPGKIAGDTKVFTQSIRALRADVQCVPSIELPYFDTGAGQYNVARSAPIPLKVRATRMVTARDGVGPDAVMSGNALENWGSGIAHNYEDPGVLADQQSGPAEWIRSPSWIGLIAIPPAIYLAILVSTVAVRRRNTDPLAIKARRAFPEFMKACRSGARDRSAAREVPLDAMRTYLGSKLRMPSAALTYRDVEGALSARGVEAETLNSLKRFFEECEVASYAGGSGSANSSALIEQAMSVGRQIEKRLR